MTALAFELLIIAILMAEQRQRHGLVKALGILWALLAVPLVIVFVHDLTVGGDRWLVLSFGLIFLSMAVEIAFDLVLRIPFRERPALHIPYIILEYGGLFGLIHIAFTIGPTWGMPSRSASGCCWPRSSSFTGSRSQGESGRQSDQAVRLKGTSQ